MSTNRKLKITIEKDEVIVIRNAASLTCAWCGACGRDTLYVRPDILPDALGIATASVAQRIESGEAHVIEDYRGTLICLKSLLQ